MDLISEIAAQAQPTGQTIHGHPVVKMPVFVNKFVKAYKSTDPYQRIAQALILYRKHGSVPSKVLCSSQFYGELIEYFGRFTKSISRTDKIKVSNIPVVEEESLVEEDFMFLGQSNENAKTQTCDEFFVRNPTFLTFPERPQCKHCLQVSTFQATTASGDPDLPPDQIWLHEHHAHYCPTVSGYIHGTQPVPKLILKKVGDEWVWV